MSNGAFQQSRPEPVHEEEGYDLESHERLMTGVEGANLALEATHSPLAHVTGPALGPAAIAGGGYEIYEGTHGKDARDVDYYKVAHGSTSVVGGAAGLASPLIAGAAPVAAVAGAGATGLYVGNEIGKTADSDFERTGKWGYDASGKPLSAMDWAGRADSAPGAAARGLYAGGVTLKDSAKLGLGISPERNIGRAAIEGARVNAEAIRSHEVESESAYAAQNYVTKDEYAGGASPSTPAVADQVAAAAPTIGAGVTAGPATVASARKVVTPTGTGVFSSRPAAPTSSPANPVGINLTGGF